MEPNGLVDPTQTPQMLLEAKEIVKSFGATKVLRGVNFTVAAGEIHALLGGNGAGKSTLIKIISGSERRDAGSLVFAGLDADHPSSEGFANVGVVHQELALFSHLTVAENIYLPRLKKAASVINFKDATRVGRRALSLIDPGLANAILHRRVGELNLHERQLVEIARVLDGGAQLVLLDEPTANLTGAEALRLFVILKQLAQARGVGIVFVSHRMQEIRQVADVCTVIRDGATIIFRTPVAELSDGQILSAIGGINQSGEPASTLLRARRALRASALPESLQHDAVVASASSEPATYRWSDDPAVADLQLGTFRVLLSEGLILGLAGTPVGPVKLMRGLIGLPGDKRWSTTVGTATRPARDPASAVSGRVGYVSGDRSKGLFPALPIVDNISVSARVLRKSIFTARSEAKDARAAVRRLSMRLSSVWSSPSTLSGGTQQKVIIARWLLLAPKLLVLEEPTRGVDAATKTDLYSIIREMANAGTSVIWWSTEHAELIELCDAVLAFDLEGNPKRILAGNDLTEALLADATGMVA